ncbi:hypothetical protein ACTHGU_21645 [Chitinophagaceae bacterium MMS25-I14]
MPVKLRGLTGYSISPKTMLKPGANYFVITKQQLFDKIMGIDKGTPVLPGAPDFSREWVIVLATPLSRTQVNMQLTNAVRAGNFIEVYCKHHKATPLTYTQHPIVIAAIPKPEGVKEVRFYTENKQDAVITVRQSK